MGNWEVTATVLSIAMFYILVQTQGSLYFVDIKYVGWIIEELFYLHIKIWL